ncbi:MAG TPA: FMN-binding protein [Desulfurivibrionaceae bacterium]|nr:FMN-binding protein [Desulfurivibrionaceae bacterium]
MKDMFAIVFRLTVSCLLAGLVMGATFVFTNKAKLHNAEVREHKVMLGLLGYGPETPAPASLQMHPVYRYLVKVGGESSIGYLLPASGPAGSGSVFVNLGLNGNFLGQEPVRLDAHQAGEVGERDAAIATALGSGKEIRYVDQTIVITDGGKRQAYLLPGEFPGFKTFINVIVAVDPAFTVTGLEIMEHEEDPGLGGEIVQGYFKNQFRGKAYEALKKLGVAKEPLPEEYRRVLENDKNGGSIGAAEVAQVEASYAAKDIYALTGATISSRAVTNGVKSIVNKFAYRIGILDRVLREQQIAVPF